MNEILSSTLAFLQGGQEVRSQALSTRLENETGRSGSDFGVFYAVVVWKAELPFPDVLSSGIYK